MKKITVILLVMFILVACGPSYTLDGKFGGSQESFEKSYGPHQEEAETGLAAIFGYISETGISAMFFEDHALFITAPLDDVTIEEAAEYAEQFLPEDAELVEDEGDRDGNMDQVYFYDSELLGETLESVGEEDPSANKQRFSVRLVAEEENRYRAVRLQADGLEFNPE